LSGQFSALTAPLPLIQFSARSDPFSAPLTFCYPNLVKFGLLFHGQIFFDSGYLAHYLPERDKIWRRYANLGPKLCFCSCALCVISLLTENFVNKSKVHEWSSGTGFGLVNLFFSD